MSDNPPTLPIKEPINKVKRKCGRPRSHKNIYDSPAQASVAEGLEVKYIKIAQKAGAPGIAHNRIDWDVFGPWYEQNKKEIEANPTTDIEVLNSYKKIRELIEYDLDIQKKRKEVIQPDDLKKWTVNLASILSSKIKEKQQHLISKCVGYEKLVNEEFLDLFSAIEKELKKWNV